MLFLSSLRLRLLTLILVPLLVVSVGAMTWQYRQSVQSAQIVFEQKLSIMALAIFRDLLATDGENLSPATRALFEEASGDRFFYHVKGPDGSFVTGYSSPPRRPPEVVLEEKQPVFFPSTHRGKPVQVVQLLERAEIDGLGGDVIVSVWQDLEQRRQFTARLVVQGMVIVGLLVLTASLVVVFGIRIGLRPLESLERAILRRTGTELGPIRRQVPVEVRQIAERLNALFAEVTAAQDEKDRFISNAAHQLRNPIAGIQSLAEVTQDAGTLAEARKRNGELIEASRQLAHLTEQLLSYERLHNVSARLEPLHLDGFLEDVARGVADRILGAGLDFTFEPQSGDAGVMADRVLLEQALVNIIDNALRHGGPAMTTIQVSSRADRDSLLVRITNDGNPVPREMRDRLFERFEQGERPAAGGAGLGLAIVSEICVMHGGSVAVDDAANGFVIRLPAMRQWE